MPQAPIINTLGPFCRHLVFNSHRIPLANQQETPYRALQEMVERLERSFIHIVKTDGTVIPSLQESILFCRRMFLVLIYYSEEAMQSILTWAHMWEQPKIFMGKHFMKHKMFPKTYGVPNAWNTFCNSSVHWVQKKMSFYQNKLFSCQVRDSIGLVFFPNQMNARDIFLERKLPRGNPR